MGIKIKEIIKIIITSFLLLLLLELFVFADDQNIDKKISYPSISEILPEEQVTTNGGIYITHEDLLKYPSIFCSAKGTPLPGKNSATLTVDGKTYTQTDQGSPLAYLTEKNKGETVADTDSWTGPVSSMNNPYSTMTSKTYAKFQVSEIRRANPAEAWVLAEMDQNDPTINAIEYTMTDEEYTGEVNEEYKYEGADSTELWAVEWDENTLEPTRFVTKKDNKYYYVECESYAPYTYVQHAWWKVKSVGTTNKSGVQDTDLADEAEAFYDYIVDVTSYNHDTSTTRDDFTSDDKNDANFNDNNTVKIDYKVEMDSSKVEVLYDAETNKYRIGPLTVDYLRSIVKCGAREPVSFAGISDSTLVGKKADDTEVTINKDAYRFVYEHDHQKYREDTLNNKIDTDESYPYPYANEEFYIELDYQEDIIALTSFVFDFQYLTAGGEYELLEGNYLIITWTPWCSWTVGGTSGNGSSSSGNGPTAQVEKMFASTELANLDVTSRAHATPSTGGSSSGKKINSKKEDFEPNMYQDDDSGKPTVGGAKGSAVLHKESEDENTITLTYNVEAPKETSQNWSVVDEYDDNGNYRYGTSTLYKRYKINDLTVESIKGEDGKSYEEGTDYTVTTTRTITDGSKREITIKINKKKGYIYDHLYLKFDVTGTTERKITYQLDYGSKPDTGWAPIDGEKEYKYTTNEYEMEYAQDVIDSFELQTSDVAFVKGGDAYIGKLGVISQHIEFGVNTKLKDDADKIGDPGKVKYTYSSTSEYFFGPDETKDLENLYYVAMPGEDYQVHVTTYTNDDRIVQQMTFNVKVPKMYINTSGKNTDLGKDKATISISNGQNGTVYIFNAKDWVDPGKLKLSGDAKDIDFIQTRSVEDYKYIYWVDTSAISEEKLNGGYNGIAEQTGKIKFSDFRENVELTINASLMSQETIDRQNEPKKITVTGPSSLKVNGEATYIAKANGEALDNISWSSSDVSIATVNDNGKVTAIGEGTVTITATSTEYGISGSKKITIGKKSKEDIEVTSVNISISSSTLVEGTTMTITATPSPPGATKATVEFSSSNPNVATVSDSGLIKAVGAGTTTITAKTPNGKSDSVTIKVTKNTTGTTSTELNSKITEIANKVNEYINRDISGYSKEQVQQMINELEAYKKELEQLKKDASTLGDSGSQGYANSVIININNLISNLNGLLSGLDDGENVPSGYGSGNGGGGTSGGSNPYTYTLSGNVLYNFKYYLKFTDASEEVAQTLINGREAEKKDVNAEFGSATTESGVPVSIEFLPDDMEIDLTTSLGGMVWEDFETFDKGEDIKADGIYNDADGDKKLSKIEVRIWKVVYEKKDSVYEEVTSGKYARTLADAYRKKTVSENGSVKLEDKIDFESDDRAKRLFTDDNGDYKVYLNIPAIEGLDTSKYKVSYDVEFIYDGQTYEVTEYLASTGEKETAKKVEKFESTSATPDNAGENPNAIDYSVYANDSYAIETYNERYAFDTKFTEVYGKEDIDQEGKTKGEASNPDSENSEEIELNYTSGDQGFDTDPTGEADSENTTGTEETRKTSTLVTKDNDGYVLSEYSMKARTSTAGLLLPYEDRIHVEDKEEDIPLEYIDTGTEGAYTYYKPINEYFSHINLGLVNRDEVDLTVAQDLYKAAITVNQDELTYKYSTLLDLENAEYADKLNMLLDMQSTGVEYEIGLYASDFYYRSDVYKGEKEETITKLLYDAKKESELRLFASYKISVYNDSRDQDVSVNELADYFDSSYSLITKNEETEIEDENGLRSNKVVAEPSYYRIYAPLASDMLSSPYHYNKEEDIGEDLVRVNRTEEDSELMASGEVTWNVDESFSQEIKAEDGTVGGTYKKMTTDTFTTTAEDGKKRVTNELTLRPGERLEIFVTFEVDHDGYETATKQDNEDATEETRQDLLGDKNSIAEVSNFTSFYTEESLNKNNNVAYKAGEVSGRVDKDSAPDNTNFEMTETKEKNGVKYTVLDKNWLEDDTDSAPVFRVYLRDKDDREREINGVVWEEDLNQAVDGVDNTSTGDGEYKEGDGTVPGVTVSLVEKIKIKESEDAEPVEYEYVWPDNAFGKEFGEYTSVTMSNEKGAYTLRNFVTGNYVVRFEYGNTALTMDHNGQDYKNTSYQEGITNPTQETIDETFKEEHRNNDQTDTELTEQITLNNEWHDLTGTTEGLTNSEDEKRVSDARDYEARRLGIIGFSRTINNSTAEILALADSQELKDLKAALAEKMFDEDGNIIEEYKPALEDIMRENETLKQFVESDEYKALIEYTAMEANTSKLKVQIEDSSDLDFGVTKKSTNGAFTVNVGGTYDQILDASKNNPDNVDKVYTVNNIDFGLERRADTIVQLDKYLKKIELQKDNEPVFRLALNDDGSIIADQSINNEKLLSLPETDGVQGFRYINMEEDYLQNTRLFIDYKVTVTNKSEVDYTSETLVNKTYTTEELEKHIESINKELVSGEGIKYGEYAGLYYYTHDTAAIAESTRVAGQDYRDEAVRTTVDQLVDYIDPNISLAESPEENTYWVTAYNDGETGIKYESLAGLISDDSYTFEDGETPKYYLQDNDGNLYVTESKSNVAISNNDEIEKKSTITTPVLERGNKGEGKLRYEIGEEGIKLNDIGQKAYEVQEIKVENVFTYPKDFNSEYKVDTYNKDLTKELTTINLNTDDEEKPTTAQITIKTEQDISNDAVIDDMIYDNLAEVLIYSNSVGRRTMSSIPGNAFEIVQQNTMDDSSESAGGGIWNAGHSSNAAKNPEIIADLEGETQEYQKDAKYALNTKEALAKNNPAETNRFIAELDADAAEFVTFTEPTGLSRAMEEQTMFIIVMLIALVILAVGIIVITLRVVMVKSTDDITIESTKE